MSKADDIRRAVRQPGYDQSAAQQRDQAGRAVVKRVRKVTADAVSASAGNMDELATEALVSNLVALISLEPGTNAAIIREMLPAYLAQHGASG